MKQTILIVMLLCLYSSCKQENEGFRIPVIIQSSTTDTIEFLNADFLQGVFFPYCGKYKFTDSLKLTTERCYDKRCQKDIIGEYCTIHKQDSLSNDGFQIFADYNATVYSRPSTHFNYTSYFPLYIVNETPRTKMFMGKDDHGFGLQEAVDTSYHNVWMPIECKGPDFCGNGCFALKVYPGEFVLLLVPKYNGNEKNWMRVRLQIGESIYFSQAYQGTFNRKQFFFKEDSDNYKELKNRKTFIKWRLYGSIPKQYEDD